MNVCKNLIDWSFAWSGAIGTQRSGTRMRSGNHPSDAQEEDPIGDRGTSQSRISEVSLHCSTRPYVGVQRMVTGFRIGTGIF